MLVPVHGLVRETRNEEIPLAFMVTFAAGLAMERLAIRWLYHRPFEILLATFGVSIALQQIVKNIFGTRARTLTSSG